MPTSSALPYISFFAISKLMLFFSYSFPVTCLILPNIYFYIVDPWFPFFLIDHNRTLVFLIKWVSCFFSEFKNIFFCSFQLFENGHFYNAVSRLINVVKLDVENSNIDSTLSNVVNINVDKQNIFSTLIWHFPTLRCHITLTTMLRQHWNVFYLLKDVAKILHNFVNFIKLKTYIFSRILLYCCFCTLSKWYG